MKRMSLFLVVTLLVALVGCSTTDIEKDNNLSSCKKTTLLETDSKEVSNKDNLKSFSYKILESFNRDDEYSISTGKKIAYSRAFAKAYKQYLEIISIIEDNFSLIMDELLTNKVRCYKILNNEEYRIDDIIKRESIKES